MPPYNAGSCNSITPPAWPSSTSSPHPRVRPTIVVFVNTHPADEHDRSTAADIRALLQTFGFHGAEVPVISGNIHKAVTTSVMDVEAPDYASIVALSRTIDRVMVAEIAEEQRRFLLPIEDVFRLKRRGLIVTGRIARGRVHVGDAVDLAGPRARTQTV